VVGRIEVDEGAMSRERETRKVVGSVRCG